MYCWIFSGDMLMEIVFSPFKVMLISWIQMLLNVCRGRRHWLWLKWGNTDTQWANRLHGPCPHRMPISGLEENTKQRTVRDGTAQRNFYFWTPLQTNACINCQPHPHVVAAIFIFYAEAKFNGLFMESLFNFVCVCGNCVWLLFFLIY